MQEVRLAARGVHGGKFDVRAEGDGVRDESWDLVQQHLGLAAAQVLHLHARRRHGKQQARFGGALDGAPRKVDAVLRQLAGAREGAVLQKRRGGVQQQGVGLAAGGAGGFNHIHAKSIQLLDALHLLAEAKDGAFLRRTQGTVGNLYGVHRNSLLFLNGIHS